MDPQTVPAATDSLAAAPETIRMFVDYAWPIATGALMALVILVIGWIASKWANRLVRKAGERGKMDQALIRFLGQIAQYTMLAAAVIAALGKVGVETTSLVAVFASAGLAVGLALQGSLGNFASGVMILFFRPFELEDVVEAGGLTGRVKDIGLFATTFHTPNNQKIIMPNGAITGGPITNFTALGTRRGNIGVGVAYGEDLARVKEVVLAATRKCPHVLEEPAPAIAFTDMAASSLNFNLMPWSQAADYLAMLDEVRSAVYDALNEAGIEIPFDQIVVHQAPPEE